MKSKEEIKERISYFQQCIVKDVTRGLIVVDQLKYYRTAIEMLEYVLDEEDKQYYDYEKM